MFFVPDEFPLVEMLPGVQRQHIGHTANIHVIRVYGLANAEIPLHQHPHEQIGTVLSGLLEMTLVQPDGSSETRQVAPGGSYVIASNMPHRARFVTDALVIETFSPAREAYIDSPLPGSQPVP